MVTFSRAIELVENAYDPTCGDGSTIFIAVTCQTCGALVDGAAQSIHTAWHEGAERPPLLVAETDSQPW